MNRLECLRQRFNEEPLANRFGMFLREFREGFASVVYTADKDECVINDSSQSIVQGGVLVGILADFAAVYATMSSIPSGHTPLMSGGFSFQRPTLVDEVVCAEAEVFNVGKQIISVSVRILSIGGKLKCEGTYHFSRPK